jgi:hypothetical protein
MDDAELIRRFDALTALMTTQTAMMNNQHERLIERLNGLARDFQNTKGFLIEDALVLGRRISNIENRLDDDDTAHPE